MHGGTLGIPARTFSTQRASVVLIGQVIGKTEVEIPLGSIPAAHLRLPVYIFAGNRIVRSLDRSDGGARLCPLQPTPA